jgi:hypothetical protein
MGLVLGYTDGIGGVMAIPSSHPSAIPSSWLLSCAAAGSKLLAAFEDPAILRHAPWSILLGGKTMG